MMQQTIIVIGNGPSLRGLDLKTLSKVDTLGMNAAYRFWDRINWYPTHYCCLDVELIATHCHEIHRLVQDGCVKTAFLNGRFLEFFPEAAKDNRYIFFDQFSTHWYKKRGKSFGLSFINSSAFNSSQPSKITTGSYAVRYAIHAGYKRIGLIGIDLQYVEKIPEAENTSGIQLVMKETPSHNPNYFFDDYQQAGDKFQVPNPDVHNFDLHPTSFEALRDDLIHRNLNVEVVNCNTQSELHARGIFPFVPLWRFIGESGLGALVVPTQVREQDRILKNLRLWQHPKFAPFLHLRGRDRPKLIFSFTGDEDENLKRNIIEEFERNGILQQYFSEVLFNFFSLPSEEDVYIQNYTLPVGKKGYKSGPNQQFFLNLFALENACQYAFFMETDCLPMCPDWLGKLYDLVQSSDEFWMLGGPYKGQAEISRKFARHLNGNAIYAVGNPNFIDFARKWQSILDETIENSDKRIAYDCVLEYFFAQEFGFDAASPSMAVDPNSEGWQLFQKVAPYLRYSNYILNYSCKVDLEQSGIDLLRSLRETHRESCVLHNKKVCDDVYALMSDQDSDLNQRQKVFGPLSISANSKLASDRPAPRILVIDITRIGDKSATGQMKQSLFGACPPEHLLQIYVAGTQKFGLYSPSSASPVSTCTDLAELWAECLKFSPDVIYYRPVVEHLFLHDCACSLIEQFNVPTVIHIVDDWPERLRYQDLELYKKLDRSFRGLLGQAAARMSVCQSMSTAFRKRYGVEFTAFANCIYPEDWTFSEELEAAATVTQSAGSDRPFTIRYLGSLATDMTHDSLLDIAKTVAELQSEHAVQLEIYTTKYWKDKAIENFSHLAGVSIHDAAFGAAYRQLLKTADALLIAYNFDEESTRYVRYSMANKFPESLASGTPVLVYGPTEVATVAYAVETQCTRVVSERNLEQLKNAIKQLIDDPEYRKTLGQTGRQYAFAKHAAKPIQAHFYRVLQQAALSKPALSSRLMPEYPLQARDSNTLLPKHLIYGEFERDRHAHVDETDIVAEWFTTESADAVMIDVGAHHGSALKHFAERKWRVYAYEPDPDNRQVLLKQVSNKSNVVIDDRAVSDRPGEKLPFFSSEESTGISTLSPFRTTHQQRCEVVTTTVAQICEEHHLNKIDFLKIDTEGYDLTVLRGVPWDKVRPRVIECEFEDRKTVPLGYTFNDLAQYLVDRGYTVLVSEWHPVIRYGIRHDWHRLMKYPCQLENSETWGNLLAFQESPDLDRVSTITQKLVTFRSSDAPASVASTSKRPQLTVSPNHSPISIEGRNGMASTPPKFQSSHQDGVKAQLNGKDSPKPQEQNQPTTAVSVVANESDPRLSQSLLTRIAHYYKRWPLGVALVIAALNTAATVDELPYSWAFSGGGTLLTLFLIGHAASKGDFAVSKGRSALQSGNRAQNAAKTAFEKIKVVSDDVATVAETANRARNTAEFSLQTANRTEVS